MRHRVYGKHLGRNKNERTALFRALVQALLIHGTIQTSEAKAKAIKGLVDKVINLAKDKNTQHLVQEFIIQRPVRDRLVKEIAPKLNDRTSGYTSMFRLGPRLGDNTMMVKLSLIGQEKLGPINKESRVKKQEVRAESNKGEEKPVRKEKAPVRKTARGTKPTVRRSAKK